MTNQIRTQAYRRENRCDLDLEKFRMPRGKSLHSTRRLPGQVDLDCQTAQVDEVLVSIPARMWDRAKDLAVGGMNHTPYTRFPSSSTTYCRLPSSKSGRMWPPAKAM
jgi:hypothetical protein